MQGIAINGMMLHEVRMLMEPYQKGTVSSLGYPKSRIRFAVDGEWKSQRRYIDVPDKSGWHLAAIEARRAAGD